MSKFIEVMAIVLGGLSLFLVCFLGFATLSGKELGSAPGIGALLGTQVPATEVQPTPGEAPRGVSTASGSASKRSEDEVVHASIGMMGAWSLPSPFSEAELKELVSEVKGQLQLVQMRDSELDARERVVREDEQAVQERYETLQALQSRLEAFGSELDLREQEVLGKEADRAQENRVRWEQVASVIGAMEVEAAGLRLAEFEPADAAQILKTMPPATAYELVNLVPPARWKEYVDAYTKLVPGSGAP